MKASKRNLERARKIHKKRTKHAQDVDKSELSRLTYSADVYETDPSRWDFPFVDTPSFWNNNQKRRN